MENNTKDNKILALSLGALGIVYGDIGTSPLYSIKECFHGLHAIETNQINIFGVLSLVFWSLTIVVSIKYVAFILKADNKGEGGIYSLLALVPSDSQKINPKIYSLIIFIAIFGASLLYGDGVITPAISVLSAIEGLEVATKAATPIVVPLTCFILFLLFLIQKKGTASIGKIFGPIMIVWFFTIAIWGVLEIINNPKILLALNPIYAYNFFAVNKLHGMIVLGSVVLCITGGEALYADLGHFGAKAIRFSWLFVAYPCLILNYLGQGALLLKNPTMSFNPFYGLVPANFLYPMVVLSTTATVIASQAMISGVFSLTRQAVQLGYFPRIKIIHTSSETEGQIYVPMVNYALMLSCISLVIIFKESSRLAGAYGIAVTATMGITSILYFFVSYKNWNWSLFKSLSLFLIFIIFDISYLGANLLKIIDGGWLTILIAVFVSVVMITWRDGRKELSQKMAKAHFPIEDFLKDIARHNIHRVKGTAVFMTVSSKGTPATLLHNIKHNQVLHEKIILLSICSKDTPIVPSSERLNIELL